MTTPNAGAVSEELNLPLDVVDTGFESYASRIEDDAGIGIAMCFSHDDAAAIVERVNACTALRQQLAELQREKAAAVGLQEGTALVVRQLEQQLAEMRGALETLLANVHPYQSDNAGELLCVDTDDLERVKAISSPTSASREGGAK